jgi:hypothetical protein
LQMQVHVGRNHTVWESLCVHARARCPTNKNTILKNNFVYIIIYLFVVESKRTKPSDELSSLACVVLIRLQFKSKLSTMPGQDYARLRQDYAGRLRCGLERSLLLMDSHYCFCVAVCPSTYLCREQQSRAWGTTHRKPRRGKPHARNPGVGN